MDSLLINSPRPCERVCIRQGERENSVCAQRLQQRTTRISSKPCGSDIDFLVDTGAPVNVIDELMFAELVDKPSISQCEVDLFGFGSTSPFDIVGQFAADISFRGKTMRVGFLVKRGDQNVFSDSTRPRVQDFQRDRDRRDVADNERHINININNVNSRPTSSRQVFPTRPADSSVASWNTRSFSRSTRLGDQLRRFCD